MDLRRLFWLSLALSCIGSAAAADVTIYRCTDAAGRLTLRDTPCRKGERQQTRAMLRPSDPAPRPVAKAAPAPSVAYSPPSRVVFVQPPRPLYECVSDDDERYTSDSAEGNLRWVPLPVLGYPTGNPVFPHRHGDFGRGYGGVSGRLQYRDGPLLARVELGRPAWPRPGYPPPNDGIGYGYGTPAGTWLRDACHALPQQEVCGRLSDRRYELDRQYNSALQSQRARITTEQRGIDARLANDCGAY